MRVIVENDRVIANEEESHMLPRIAAKSIEYIHNQTYADKPFFLFVALSAPHNPIVPTDEWKGKSGLGDYADFVMMTDGVVGDISQAIQLSGLAEKTILIFTPENGQNDAGSEQVPSLSPRYKNTSLWDLGNRMYFIICWTGVGFE
mgnify:CR=1 FL=1